MLNTLYRRILTKDYSGVTMVIDSVVCPDNNPIRNTSKNL